MRLLAFVLQLLCILLTFIGLCIAYGYQDDSSYVFITAGALMFAVAEKVHRFQDNRPAKGSWYKLLKSKRKRL